MAWLLGALLMAIGGLIALLSGLFSSAFIIGFVVAELRGNARNTVEGATLLLEMGGLPFLAGLMLIFVGRGLYRVDARQAEDVSRDGPTHPT